MPGRRRVHLLFEHALVDRGHRPLRPAEHAGAEPFGGPEGVLGHRPAHRPVDALGPPGLLVRATGRAVTPLGGPIGVAHGHAHHDDRMDHRGERDDTRDPATRPDDHRATDPLAQDAVGRADVAGLRRGDGGRLEAETHLDHGLGRLGHDGVLRTTAVLEGQVEPDRSSGTPTTDGSSTRSASSSSSCPVSSPSQTTSACVLGHRSQGPTSALGGPVGGGVIQPPAAGWAPDHQRRAAMTVQMPSTTPNGQAPEAKP